MLSTTPERFRMETNFQGLIKLLAEHLYSEPDVFVRELVQNASDSIVRRRRAEPDRPGRGMKRFGDIAIEGKGRLFGWASSPLRPDLTVAPVLRFDGIGRQREFKMSVIISLLANPVAPFVDVGPGRREPMWTITGGCVSLSPGLRC